VPTCHNDDHIDLLLIEDNAGDALLVSQVAAECRTPVALRIASDGDEALQMLADPEHYQPDLIILDLNLPKVPGLTFLERYRPKDVPVVIFSSSPNAVEIQNAIALGAREFVRKPIDFKSFAEAVQGIIDRWKTQGCVTG
jgi:CheY-like chemotaxis protein